MSTDPIAELYDRVSGLRDQTFALIEELHEMSRGMRAGEDPLDLTPALAALQGVANRLGRAQATLAASELSRVAGGPAGGLPPVKEDAEHRRTAAG